jgi:CRISPR/Cas system-associated exonuclease Cas4 (RecB family)
MKKWERQLEEYAFLIKQLVKKQEKGEGKLRFNRYLITASDIAEQYFCEKKVEMQYLHGKIETEAKILGTEAHEKLLEDTIKIKTSDLWQKIYGKKPIFALEMFLVAKYNDIILVGRPDSIVFEKGFPLIVFEYKFSRSGRPFRDHHVQARTYGILLQNMGFDTSQLFYAIVIVDPKAKDDEKLKQKVVEAVIKNGPREATISIEDARIYFNKFNQANAEQDLQWAIGFWKNKREAIPTRNPNKCKTCEYNTTCEK